MLESLKNSLRISHNKLDSDIMSNVDACMEDLKRVGVFVPFDADDCSAILKKLSKTMSNGSMISTAREKISARITSVCETH